MTLSNAWQQAPKRWGHAFHAMCSYLAMFPPRLPHYFIEKFTRPGDAVLDPFCGRGTTPLEACLAGRIGIGLDLNPLACVLSRAKVDPPPKAHLEARLRTLENDMFYGETEPEPPRIKMLFHPHTLRQLVFLKQVLDLGDPCDNFIAATVLGILHGAGSHDRKRSSYLSISMPNTFSLSPNYIRGYLEAKGLKQLPINVFTALRKKFRRLFAHEPPATRGQVYCDSVEHLTRLPNPQLRKRRVKLIVTSPPCLHVVRYGLYNWIRLWFLNEDPDALDGRLATHRRLDDYLAFMQRALRRMYTVLEPGGVCCVVVGDVFVKARKATVNLAEELWNLLRERHSPFQLYDIIEDRVPERRKVSKLWGDKRGRATEVDRVLVLFRDSIEELTDVVKWNPPKKRKKKG